MKLPDTGRTSDIEVSVMPGYPRPILEQRESEDGAAAKQNTHMPSDTHAMSTLLDELRAARYRRTPHVCCQFAAGQWWYTHFASEDAARYAVLQLQKRHQTVRYEYDVDGTRFRNLPA